VPRIDQVRTGGRARLYWRNTNAGWIGWRKRDNCLV